VSAKKLMPFGAAILLALVVVGGDRLVGWDSSVIYGLVGLFAGVLLVAGPLFAFGIKALDSSDPVRARIPTPSASYYGQRDSFSEGYFVIRGQRLQQRHLVREEPAVVTADRASGVRIKLVEDTLDTSEVSHRLPSLTGRS